MRDASLEPFLDRAGSADEPTVALVAVEDEPGIWDGFWTTDSTMVREIDEHVAREL